MRFLRKRKRAAARALAAALMETPVWFQPCVKEENKEGAHSSISLRFSNVAYLKVYVSAYHFCTQCRVPLLPIAPPHLTAKFASTGTKSLPERARLLGSLDAWSTEFGWPLTSVSIGALELPRASFKEFPSKTRACPKNDLPKNSGGFKSPDWSKSL